MKNGEECLLPIRCSKCKKLFSACEIDAKDDNGRGNFTKMFCRSCYGPGYTLGGCSCNLTDMLHG